MEMLLGSGFVVAETLRSRPFLAAAVSVEEDSGWFPSAPKCLRFSTLPEGLRLRRLVSFELAGSSTDFFLTGRIGMKEKASKKASKFGNLFEGRPP